MNNDNRNSLEMLQSSYAHEKKKDRKHLLRLEIIKATDPQIKKQLELMLDEIEAEEVKNRRIAIIISFTGILLLSLFFLYTILYPNKHDASTLALDSSSEAMTVEASTKGSTDVSKKSTIDTSTEFEQSTEDGSASQNNKQAHATVQDESSSTYTSEYNGNYSEVDTTNLTEQQVIDWVWIHVNWKKSYLTKDDFNFDLKFGDGLEDSKDVLIINVTVKPESQQIDNDKLYKAKYMITPEGVLFGKFADGWHQVADNYNE
jgi:hypothetical protein